MAHSILMNHSVGSSRIRISVRPNLPPSLRSHKYLRLSQMNRSRTSPIKNKSNEKNSSVSRPNSASLWKHNPENSPMRRPKCGHKPNNARLKRPEPMRSELLNRLNPHSPTFIILKNPLPLPASAASHLHGASWWGLYSSWGHSCWYSWSARCLSSPMYCRCGITCPRSKNCYPTDCISRCISAIYQDVFYPRHGWNWGKYI